MQVSVESPSQLERHLTIIVPNEKIEAALNSRLSKLGKTVKINGFRPGKVPLDVIKQRYGETARQEALGEVIQSSLYAAIHQEKLQPVGVPTVEPKSIVEGMPLEFVAKFEVMPVIEKVTFDVTEIEKQVAIIGEADVDRVVQHLIEQHIKWKTVSRAAEDKDRVLVDFAGCIDGTPFANGEAKKYPIVLGNKTMVPGFEEGILGMKANEEKVIHVTFPENYFAKEVAGKVADFTIKVIEVSAPEYPEQNEDFFKKLGIKSGALADLRAEITNNLQRELKRAVKAKLKAQVLDLLVKQNPIDLPRSLVQRETKRLHDELHPHHHGEEHHHTEEEMKTFEDAARKNVIAGLLVAHLVKKHQLSVTREQVQEFLALIATSYEKPDEWIKWYQQDRRRMAEVETQVLEEQVINVLLENVKITEKEIPYSELMR